MIRSGGVEVVVDQAALQALVMGPNGPIARHMARIGARVEGRAKELLSGELVNVQSGRLRSSTSWRPFTRGNLIGVLVGSSVGYGVFVHQGTRYMAARPFLRIAARDVLGPSVV